MPRYWRGILGSHRGKRLQRSDKCRTNYRIRRHRLSRLLLVQEARHPSPRIIRTLGPTHMNGSVIDARDYVLRKLPWDLSRLRFMQFQREAIDKIAAVDTGFRNRLRTAAIQVLSESENVEEIRRALTALAFSGKASDIHLVERFRPHSDPDVAKFASACMFELKNVPNQLPDPTSQSVTPPADAGVAPSVAADH